MNQITQSKWLALAVCLSAALWCGSAKAEFKELPDGSVWTCYDRGVPNLVFCMNVRTGALYRWWQPLTVENVLKYGEYERRQDAEARCSCSRAIHGGGASGNGDGTICTGAYDPYLLRQSKTDPCRGAWATDAGEGGSP